MKTNEELAKFGEMMIETMKEMESSNWEKPWVSESFTDLPKNVKGRRYNGLNILYLSWFLSKRGLHIPVFATFNQFKEMNCMIKKGSKAFPVFFWSFLYVDEDGNKKTEDDYRFSVSVGLNNINKIPLLKTYNVFSVEQTNLNEVNPELYAKFVQKEVIICSDTDGMFASPELDTLISEESWICPIYANRESDEAFYAPACNHIVLPMKRQFKTHRKKSEIYTDGQRFYSAMLHEMAHSTKTVTKRDMKDYGKEELVAELTAAIVGKQLGFEKRIEEESATYLNAWIKNIQEQPQFIVSVMSQVSKAMDVILDKITAKEKVEN